MEAGRVINLQSSKARIYSAKPTGMLVLYAEMTAMNDSMHESEQEQEKKNRLNETRGKEQKKIHTWNKRE